MRRARQSACKRVRRMQPVRAGERMCKALPGESAKPGPAFKIRQRQANILGARQKKLQVRAREARGREG